MKTICLKPATVGLLVALMSVLFGTAKADVVSDWNTIAVNTFVANKQNPFSQGRYVAIVQLAVFEAVNSITGKYRPYLGMLPRRPWASPEAAAIEASYQVLNAYFPSTLLTNTHDHALAQIPDSQAKLDGIAAGDDAATAMVALRAHDGAAVGPFTSAPGPASPGVWQLTAKNCTAGIAFNWQFVTPFGIPSAHKYLLSPPPALTSEAYTKAYDEVMSVGEMNSTTRPQDRANVALFFAAASPTQALNQAAQQVAQEKGASLTENARALALMNMAINDSLVASFLNKYHYNFWRPETAIHGGDTDGNPKTDADPNWAPFITTPCFPSYPSNHGSAGNAAAEVLRRVYGEAGHSITLTNPTVPTIILQYTSFRQITDDISDARVYGGIHFRTDQEAGADLGRAVGAAVYKNNLRRLHHGDDHDRDDR